MKIKAGKVGELKEAIVFIEEELKKLDSEHDFFHTRNTSSSFNKEKLNKIREGIKKYKHVLVELNKKIELRIKDLINQNPKT